MNPELYLYLLITTGVVFGLFGHIQGKMLDHLATVSEKLVSTNRELERVSRSDSLTTLYNAKALHELLAKWVALHDRARTPLSVLVITVQDMREVNQKHGRPVADEYLRHIAHLLLRQRRQEDIVGRIGGAEFAILLPNTAIDDTGTVAHRVSIFLQETPFILGGERIACPVAMGATQLGESDDARSVLARAEVALYQAKRNGKGKYVALTQGKKAHHH